MSALSVLAAVAAVVVLAEALARLEHARPLAPGLVLAERAVEACESAAWAALAMGAGVTGLQVLGGTPVTPAHALMLTGVALFALRARAKEMQRRCQKGITCRRG